MSTTDTSRFRDLLLRERSRVEAAIENLQRENPGSLEEETGEETMFDNHLGDAATATYDRELDYSLEDGEARVLRSIDRALARIDEGTYGTCARCGKPIPEERLEARPWAELCIEHQRELERG
jgi:RNA polymerase-binding protein DksA